MQDGSRPYVLRNTDNKREQGDVRNIEESVWRRE